MGFEIELQLFARLTPPSGLHCGALRSNYRFWLKAEIGKEAYNPCQTRILGVEAKAKLKSGYPKPPRAEMGKGSDLSRGHGNIPGFWTGKKINRGGR